MKPYGDESFDPEVEAAARMLRDLEFDDSGVRMDRIKLRAMRQANTRHHGGKPMKSRLTALVTVALLAVGGGATAAIGGVGGGGAPASSSADKQYVGKKCGQPDRGPQNQPPGNPSNSSCPPQAGQK